MINSYYSNVGEKMSRRSNVRKGRKERERINFIPFGIFSACCPKPNHAWYKTSTGHKNI
jgi:hypothetical protein